MAQKNEVINQTITQTITKEPRGNGLGTAALVLGIIGIVFAFIPFMDFGTGIIPLVGLILGLVGLSRQPKKPAIVGSIVAGVGVLLTIVMTITYVSVFFAAVSNTVKEANTPVSVTYEVDGAASDASVTYSTYTNGTSTANQATSVALPFTKTVTGTKGFSGYTVTGTNGQKDIGDISCKITIAGKVVAQQTSTGAFASVTCSSTGSDD